MLFASGIDNGEMIFSNKVWVLQYTFILIRNTHCPSVRGQRSLHISCRRRGMGPTRSFRCFQWVVEWCRICAAIRIRLLARCIWQACLFELYMYCACCTFPFLDSRTLCFFRIRTYPRVYMSLAINLQLCVCACAYACACACMHMRRCACMCVYTVYI
jgi:hypothetical protein